jgi:dihydroflavonol-4-reductase
MAGQLILVTGISGFIGKHCALELLNHGYKVRGTVRNLDKAEQVKSILAKHCDVSALEFVATDLMSDDNWPAAMQNVYGVLHVASPVAVAQPKDPEELIQPARQGTMRAIRSAAEAGVKRFIHTSSIAAVYHGYPPSRTAPFTEDDWTIVATPGVTAYAKSKALAERVARDFIEAGKSQMYYASINPGIVLGPVLDGDLSPSAKLVQDLMRGKYPGCPRLAFSFVDVRDVAKMHRLALESSQPSGGRYIAAAEVAWLVDLARAIKSKLGAPAYKVPRLEVPNLLVRLSSLFDPEVRSILPDLGHPLFLDNSRTIAALGIKFIPLAEAAPATAQSLLDLKLV